MLKRFVKSGIAIIVAFSMIVMPNTFANVEAATNYNEVATQAQTAANSLTTLYGVTSVQYALIDNGEIVISGQSGVYSKDNNTALTKEHMYGIGSVSKMFTTVAVMQLVEQGKIKLESPVVNYIPEFKMADERYKDITVRMLLNHSSGLMGSTFSNAMLFDDNDTVSMDTLLEELKTQRLKADPGAFSVYCNDGFGLAQLVVEKVSGLSFSDYVTANISNPLTMNHTKTPLDQFQKDQIVKTYQAGSYSALPVENVNAIGAGGIYSTAEDLCRFAEIFMSDNKILSDTSAKAMANSEYLNGLWCPEGDSTLSYGLGWDSVNTYPFTQYGIKALVKGGDTLSFHCSLIALPEEDMAMAVLFSGGSSIYGEAFAQEILLKALLAQGSIKEIKADKTFSAPVKAAMPVSEKENAGYYAFMSGLMKADISDDGVLTLVVEGANPQQFVYTGDGRFYYSDGSTYIRFVKEDNGNTYLYTQGYATLPYLGQIVSSGYQGQKIATNTLSKKVKAAWEKRDNQKYFLLNEKYSSAVYSVSTPFTVMAGTDGIEGYCQGAKIIDANNAQRLIQIPGNLGRDLFDLSFYAKDKVEYLKAGGSIYLNEDAVKALSKKSTFTVNIGSEGYAAWYKIGAKLANKKMKVTLLKNSTYSVYDANGTCTFNSQLAGSTTATLTSEGYIVFVGDAGAKFTVKYTK